MSWLCLIMKSINPAYVSNDSLWSWLNSYSGSAVFFQFFSLFDNEAFLLLDGQQQVLYWSNGAEQLTGFKSIDVSGQIALSELTRYDGVDKGSQLVSIMKSDGSNFQLDKTVKVLTAENHAVIGFLVRLKQSSGDAQTPK